MSKRGKSVILLLLVTVAVAAVLALSAGPCSAQEPTPTPQVVAGTSGTFVVVPEVSYGDGGVIVALVFVAGVELLRLVVSLAERVADR